MAWFYNGNQISGAWTDATGVTHPATWDDDWTDAEKHQAGLISTAEKDELWAQLDLHTAYLKGENESCTSYDDSIFFISQMLDHWNYIDEKDKTAYQAVLSVTTRKDLETQAAVNKTNRDYLASTDWYITRKSDTGVAVPADILTKRQEARVAVIE